MCSHLIALKVKCNMVAPQLFVVFLLCWRSHLLLGSCACIKISERGLEKGTRDCEQETNNVASKFANVLLQANQLLCNPRTLSNIEGNIAGASVQRQELDSEDRVPCEETLVQRKHSPEQKKQFFILLTHHTIRNTCCAHARTRAHTHTCTHTHTRRELVRLHTCNDSIISKRTRNKF